MASGPYQSNLLRFLVGQYHQGINRHRQAVRKTRTQVELGAQVGVAVALSSVQSVVQASRRTGQKLASSVLRLRLVSARDRPTARFIDFSDFDRRILSGVAKSDSISQMKIRHMDAGLNDELAAYELVAGLLRSPDAAWLAGESAMAQSLTLLGDCLQPAQVKTMTIHRSFVLSKAFGWCRRLTRWWRKPLDNQSSAVSWPSQLAARSQGQITGLASDVKTRSLQLIIDCKRPWNGLSDQQQTAIQRKIWALLGPLALITQKSLTIDSVAELNNPIALKECASSQIALQKNEEIVPISVRRLVKFVQSFWIVLLQVLDEWMGNYKVPVSTAPVAQIALSPSSADQNLVHYRPVNLLSSSNSGSPARFSLKADDLHSLTLSRQGGGGGASVCWEADVVSVNYIEHPLEKLLKWIDRIFLWLEKLWQTLHKKHS
ncbi:MAG: hypothetical protein AAFN40_16400 [Cyanobacteria bacterium J06560_6]